jgi:hypothetical protein
MYKGPQKMWKIKNLTLQTGSSLGVATPNAVLCKLKTAGRAGLKPIGPIASNWVPRVRGPAPSYQLLAVQVHTTTHNRFYIEQHWASQLPRTTLSVGLDSLFSTSFEDLYTYNIKWSFPNSIFHILSM